MCGIAGIVRYRGQTWASKEPILSMLAVMEHRGPDDEGAWSSKDGRVVLGHRRLSIVDLSAAGRQPFVSGDGRHVMIYNGEIYNFRELREQLDDQTPWLSQSDTEVLLKAYVRWGTAVLDRLDGMFAFAIWDAREETLFLARDPFGEKPLFFSRTPEGVLFASTLNAMLVGLQATPLVNYPVLASYFNYGFIESPDTIYRGIEKLRAGSWIMFRRNSDHAEVYWYPQANNHHCGFDEAVHRTEEVLKESLKRRLIADVPVGCFLSGGVDSSLVTALAAQQKGTRLKTFSVGFNEMSHDELHYAQRVVDIYKTDHHHITLTADALEVLPLLSWHSGEPYADHSLVPTYHLSKLAREEVKVAVSGDGADEIFGGYVTSYSAWLAQYYRQLLPRHLRQLVALSLKYVHQTYPGNSIRWLYRFAEYGIKDPLEAYKNIWTNLWKRWEHNLYTPNFRGFLNGYRSDWIDQYFEKSTNMQPYLGVLHAEMRGRLCDDFLVKVDTASMANSLEVRSPYLSRSLSDALFGLPGHVIFHHFCRKAILKKIGEKYLPRNLLYRKKSGFTMPVGMWLRSPRYGLLLKRLTERPGIVGEITDVGVVNGVIQDHLAGKADHGARLFCLLYLDLWHRIFVEKSLSPTTPLSES